MAFHNPLSDTVAIGYFAKPHGVMGEINMVLEQDVEPGNLSCIVVDIDGINVPFFFTALRSRGYRSYLVNIDGITNEVQAAGLTNKTVYALRKDVEELLDEVDEDGFYVADLVGFTLKTINGDTVGSIVDYDDSTDNVLLIVHNNDGSEMLVPVANEFIDDIDPRHKVIVMNLPEGLIDL